MEKDESCAVYFGNFLTAPCWLRSHLEKIFLLLELFEKKENRRQLPNFTGVIKNKNVDLKILFSKGDGLQVNG